MPMTRRPWQEELAIIDRTMRAISGVTDPAELVDIYWTGIGALVPVRDYVAISRRNMTAPNYVLTRSSRFTDDINPWTHKHLLPHYSGGILAEIAYANQPVLIDDLPARLTADEPARSHLEGFQSLVALPQYDGGESLNVTVMLLPPGDEFDPTMIPMMHWQAGLFGRGTTNLVLRNQLSAALFTLDQELKTVGDIQRSLLPGALPPIPGFEIAAHYQTSARAGGDYYDFFPLDNGAWGLFIADVSGHGTPAAVLMAITHAIAHAQPGTHTPPADLLNYLNHQLVRSYTRGGTFVTAFYAVLDPATRTMTYSRAGHNPPRLVRGGGGAGSDAGGGSAGRRIASLDADGGLPLGIMDEQPYTQTTVTLDRGDLLLLYTDGITEAVAPQHNGRPWELFGLERLDALLLDCGGSSAQGCIDRVCTEVAKFCDNAPPTDDQTLIAIRCL